MLSKHLFSSLACALFLAGCASTAPPPLPPPKAPATVASLMSEAEAAIKLGNNEQGVAILKTAAVAFPNEAAPRLRAAQVLFECHNYGEAISYAQEVLERDPNDMAAHSIMAASGLRVSSKALNDLASRNNIVGSVRAEAQDLVKLVRGHIHGAIIPPPKPNGKLAGGKMPAPAALAPPPRQSRPAGNTPADWLNN